MCVKTAKARCDFSTKNKHFCTSSDHTFITVLCNIVISERRYKAKKKEKKKTQQMKMVIIRWNAFAVHLKADHTVIKKIYILFVCRNKNIPRIH